MALELRLGLEDTAIAEAQAQKMALESYLQVFLKKYFLRSPKDASDKVRGHRVEILSCLQSKYVGLPGGNEVFAAHKKEEKALKSVVGKLR